jgi:hypothetical protein
MQQLKPLAELLQPDPTNLFFGGISPVGVTLENIHAMVSGICLHESVPEDVRSYFESIKNLAVFGWFHYPLYTHAVFLATTALDDTLPSSRRWHADEPDLDQAQKTAETKAEPQQSYAEYAWRMMLILRNKFLHQQQSTILTPWMAADHLSLAAEMINALFADTGLKTC